MTSKKTTRPSVGTTMFCVCEHLYYISGRAGPAKEYVIFEGVVTGYHDAGWVDVTLEGRDADGHMETVHRRLKDIGSTLFFTVREAALLAESMTEDYERRWGWTERWGDVPLRRPWQVYLDEAATRDVPMFFVFWLPYWWQLKGEDALMPAADSFRAAEEEAFRRSGFHSYKECEEWNRAQEAARGIAHTNKGYYGPKKVAGPGHSGTVASNYKSTCPHYMGYYLGGEYPGCWTECQLGGLMTGAAWYEFCGKRPENCPLRKDRERDEGGNVDGLQS